MSFSNYINNTKNLPISQSARNMSLIYNTSSVFKSINKLKKTNLKSSQIDNNSSFDSFSEDSFDEENNKMVTKNQILNQNKEKNQRFKNNIKKLKSFSSFQEKKECNWLLLYETLFLKQKLNYDEIAFRISSTDVKLNKKEIKREQNYFVPKLMNIVNSLTTKFKAEPTVKMKSVNNDSNKFLPNVKLSKKVLNQEPHKKMCILVDQYRKKTVNNPLKTYYKGKSDKLLSGFKDKNVSKSLRKRDMSSTCVAKTTSYQTSKIYPKNLDKELRNQNLSRNVSENEILSLEVPQLGSTQLNRNFKPKFSTVKLNKNKSYSYLKDQVYNGEVDKQNRTVLYPEIKYLLSDNNFIQFLKSKEIKVEDAENIIHAINSYEKEWTNIKNYVVCSNMIENEFLLNFETLKENIKNCKASQKFIDVGLVDSKKTLIDKILERIKV